MRREYPKKYGIVSFAPYVGISQQVQRVRFCLLNYTVVPLLDNSIGDISLKVNQFLQESTSE